MFCVLVDNTARDKEREEKQKENTAIGAALERSLSEALTGDKANKASFGSSIYRGKSGKAKPKPKSTLDSVR